MTDSWLRDILPEDGDDWTLYIYPSTGTYPHSIYRVLSNLHLKLDAANTDGAFLNVEDYGLVPTFDTTNNVHISIANQVAFISDGTHPVRKWTGSTLENGHYIIDSAIVGDVTYSTTLKAVVLSLSTGLVNNAPGGDIGQYASSHYCVVFDPDKEFPLGSQDAVMRSPIYYSPNTMSLGVYADLIDEKAITEGQRIYVTMPSSEGYSFSLDTIFQGIADSIIRYDTVAAPPAAVNDTLLTQFSIDSLVVDADSVTVTLDRSYSSVDDYEVVYSYEDAYKSRIMVRKVNTDEFRFIRPPRDDAVKQVFNWVAVGVTADTDSADAQTYGNDWLWQRGITLTGASASKDVDLTFDYATTNDYRPLATQYEYGVMSAPRQLENQSKSQFRYTNANHGETFGWITVGTPDTPGEANSSDDTLVVTWGVDTLAVGAYTSEHYFEDVYNKSPNVCISIIDTTEGVLNDTIPTQLAMQLVNKSRFVVKRRYATKQQIFSWISVGAYVRTPADDTNHVTLVYDSIIISDDSIYRDEDLFTASYIFKIIDGPGAEDTWWSDGTPCTLHRTDDDNLTLRICAPVNDFSGDEITLPPHDSASYIVLQLNQYPPVAFTKLRQNRMWFVSGLNAPNTVWYSPLENAAGLGADMYYDDLNLAHYELVGADDKDEMTGVNTMQQWLIFYKQQHIYVLADNNSPFDIYEKSSNYGLWSDGFSQSYMQNEFSLHRLGLFGFNSATVTPHSQLSGAVASFFADSLNQSEMDLVRGEIYDDYLLVSFPTGSGTKNDKTLVLDLRTGAWTEWSFAGASYVTRRAPDGLDSLLWGSPDSASIFVMGGTSDAGTEIEMEYQTPYMDFGSPTIKKQVRAISVSCQANSACSLALNFYIDDLQSSEYSDYFECDTLLGYDSPQHLILDLPASMEFGTHCSVKLTSVNADSLKISKLGMMYLAKQEIESE